MSVSVCYCCCCGGVWDSGLCGEVRGGWGFVGFFLLCWELERGVECTGLLTYSVYNLDDDDGNERNVCL